MQKASAGPVADVSWSCAFCIGINVTRAPSERPGRRAPEKATQNDARFAPGDAFVPGPVGDNRSMSYQVLARKWRPATFADLAGQEHVVTALANSLDRGLASHAYLLAGPGGGG